MSKSTALVLAAFIDASAFAQTPASAICEAKGADKKLAGAAKKSFAKKCEKAASSGAGLR